jgi:hypothetical protein
MVPVAELPPWTPFTCQVTLVFVVPLTVALNCFVLPPGKVTAAGEIVTDTTTTGALMLTVALAEYAELATLVAVIVTDPPDGTAAGAVYSPEEVIVPVVELPPATPFTDHITPVFTVPETEAENCFVHPTCSTAEVGEIVTEMEGAVEPGNQGQVAGVVPYSNSPMSHAELIGRGPPSVS